MMRSTHRLKIWIVVILFIPCWFGSGLAHAATKDQAVSLAQEIMQVTMETQSREPISSNNVNDIAMDIIYQRRSDNLQAFLQNLENKEALENFDLFEHYANLTNYTVGNLIAAKNYQLISNETISKNWRRAYLSNLLLAQLHLGKGDVLKVLEFTGKSLEIVNQQDVTRETSSMMYEVYDMLQTAYIYDRSTDQTIAAMRTLKDLSVKSGRPLDGFSIVNNLAVLFSKDNQHLEAIEIMGVMEPYLTRQSDDKIMLYNFSIAKFKNRAKLYNDALPHLEKIEILAQGNWLQPYIYNELAQSYAYSGQISESEAIMNKLDALPDEDLPKSDLFELSLMNVKSLVAEMRGDYKTALNLKNEYSDRSIERISAAQFQDRKKSADRIAVSQRVATQKLENAARESALKDTIIDREKNINRISLGLLGLAAILVGLLIYGVRHQRAMNVKLAVSRDKALASERAKSDFLAMMSHEVRTPLNSIIPVAELLQAKSEYKDDRGLLALIVAGGNTLLQMLDNILVVSKADDRPPEYAEDLNLVKIAQPILQEFGDEARKKGLTFSAKAKKGFPLSVHTDKKVIEKILINLLSNAVKFTSKGEIDVTFARAEDEDYFSIRIQDTGIGMKGENFDELLAPFKQKDSGLTRKFDGLGIGLSVTNIEVQRLGGQLCFHTDLDIGTAVEVILPIMGPVQQQEALQIAA